MTYSAISEKTQTSDEVTSIFLTVIDIFQVNSWGELVALDDIIGDDREKYLSMISRETQQSTQNELTLTSSQDRMSMIDQSFDIEIKPRVIPTKQSLNEKYKHTAQMNLPLQRTTLQDNSANVQSQRHTRNESRSKDIYSRQA